MKCAMYTTRATLSLPRERDSLSNVEMIFVP